MSTDQSCHKIVKDNKMSYDGDPLVSVGTCGYCCAPTSQGESFLLFYLYVGSSTEVYHLIR